jgi:hypothetical protein
MSQKQNFITTTDQETAEKLISAGFQLVSQSGSVYTFLNQSSNNFKFDATDKKKVAYTNTLNI